MRILTKAFLTAFSPVLLALSGVSFAYAQSDAITGPIVLSDYLQVLASKHEFYFSYDSDLLRGVKINIDSANQKQNEVLKLLADASAFDFQQINSTDVLVRPKAAGLNLKICATVIDEETKNQITGTYVYDESKSFTLTTNESGYFSALVNLSNSPTIQFRALGYESKIISIQYFNGTGCPVISLKPSTVFLDQVTIGAYLVSGIDYQFKENTIEINPSGMGLLPGETDADILMALDALPGINTPDSKAGNLNIRGSTADQTLILFDNIPIYHRGHYFGTFSPYNPTVVDQVKIYRSAYMADKGGRVGGAIEISSKKNIPDSTVYSVGLASTYGSAYTHIPLVKDKMSFLLAGRSTYAAGWVPPKLKTINEFIYQETEVQRAEKEAPVHLNTSDYSFYDLNSKMIVRPSANDEINLSFLAINNEVELEIQDDTRNSRSYDKMNMENFGYDLSWYRKWSDKITMKMNGTRSSYTQTYLSKTNVQGTTTEDAFFKNRMDDFNLKVMADAAMTEKSSFNFGYDLRHHDQHYNDYTFLEDGSVTDLSQDNSTYLHSVFGNYTVATLKYSLTAGLRTNLYTLTDDINLEPRGMLNYFLNDHWAFKASSGIYNQFVMQIPGVAIESVGGIENLVWQLADGKKIPIVKSKQGMLGGIYHHDTWIIDLELYYKVIDDMAINNIVNFSSDTYLYGSSKTKGADLLVKKQWNRVDTWMSYSLSKSDMSFDSIQNASFLSVFDQTHIVDVVAAYRIGPWKFSVGWKYRTGLAALPGIRTKWLHGAPGEQQTAPPPPPPPPQGAPPRPPQRQPNFVPGSVEEYTDRFPAYHQLDISAVYSMKRKKWNSTIGLSLLNVYDRQNIIEQIARRSPARPGVILVNKYAIGFAPNLVVTVSW